MVQSPQAQLGEGTHWLRLADRNWRSCKISHAVKRKGHVVRSSGFAAQNPVRVASHSKADVFLMVVCHMKSRWRHSETTIFGQSWAGVRSAGMFMLFAFEELLIRDLLFDKQLIFVLVESQCVVSFGWPITRGSLPKRICCFFPIWVLPSLRGVMATCKGKGLTNPILLRCWVQKMGRLRWGESVYSRGQRQFAVFG